MSHRQLASSHVATFFTISALTLASVSPVMAATKAPTPKLGATCTKAGASATVGGKLLKCDKKSKTLVWLLAPVAKPSNSSPASNSSTSGAAIDPKKGAGPAPGGATGSTQGFDPNKSQGATQGVDPNKSTNGDKKLDGPNPTAIYITAIPVDLTQIQAISKYRSCSGHNRDGYTFDQVLETNRSLKHYLFPTTQFQGTTDKVKLFAPFDGTVSSISLESAKVGGRPQSGNGIGFATPVDPMVEFVFGHVYFSREFKVGEKIKAGELIGFASLAQKEFDFDLDLHGLYRSKDGAEILDSIFDHMTPKVLESFAKFGVTPTNTKESKASRDAKPCDFNAGDDRSSTTNWIQFKQ